MSKKIKLTKEKLIKLFYEWEKDIRLKPDEYRNEEEVRALNANESARLSADHFINILNKLK